MKVLVVEDWWADRVRFQYLLSHINKISPSFQLDFAWVAGRPPKGGRVWTSREIVKRATDYDRIIIDLALTKEDEDQFRYVHSLSDKDFLRREDALDEQITGLKLIQSLAEKYYSNPHMLREQVIIASAHVYDRLREHCLRKWGIIDTFHKWSDENKIIHTLYESRLRSNDKHT